MATMGFASDTLTEKDMHTGDNAWTDVLDAAIADADITDGAEYLLVVTAQLGGSSGAQTFGFRIVQGTTPTVFISSTMIFEPSGTAIRHNYCYIKKFTASASAGENIIKAQFQCTSDSTEEVTADTIVMLAIKLDDLDAADWKYGENTTGTTHTTSFVDFATTGAFTPADNNDDWLVLFCINYAVNSASVNTEVRSRLDGSTATPADDAPFFSEEGEDETEQKVFGLSRVHTLSNSAHQFWVQARDDQTGVNTHDYSAIFALRLNAFQDHASQWIEAELTLSTDDTLQEIAAIAPNIGPVTSDVIVIGSAVADIGAVGRQATLVATLGGTTIPVGRGDNSDVKSYDADDENFMFTMFILTSQSGVLDLDLDAKVQTVADTMIEDRSFVAFSVEIAAVGVGIAGIRNPMAGPVALRNPLGVG